MSIFNKNSEVEKLKVKIDEMVETHDRQLMIKDVEHQKEIKALKADHAREIKMLTEDFESKERIYKAEEVTRINTAIEKEKDLRVKAEANVEATNKEVEMLRTAFKNLGFDVKDMKDILNKLVDGVVSGNKINVIKTD